MPPALGLVALPVVLAVIVAYDFRLTRRPPAALAAVPGLAMCLALPWLLPASWIFPRCLASVWALALSAKTFDCATGRGDDPRMWQTLPRFVFWMLVPPDSQPAGSPQDAEAARRDGRRRLARLVPKLPGIAVLVAFEMRWPAVHDVAWIESFWALWLTWLSVSALTDLVSGVAMQSGHRVRENFDAPPLAASPREFWGRRWNLFVHRFAMRHLFLATGGRKHPLRATLLVFLASGLAHEVFLVVVLGRASSYPGLMLAFFSLHGVVVAAEIVFDRRMRRRPKLPRSLAVALHLVWITATAPLFFAPLGEIFSALASH